MTYFTDQKAGVRATLKARSMSVFDDPHDKVGAATDQGSLRSVRDFARKEWPFGQFG